MRGWAGLIKVQGGLFFGMLLRVFIDSILISTFGDYRIDPLLIFKTVWILTHRICDILLGFYNRHITISIACLGRI